MINSNWIMHYFHTHNLWEIFYIIFMVYFLILYAPIRFVLGVFFCSHYRRCIDSNMVVYGLPFGHPTVLGGLNLMKSFRLGEKAYRNLKPMPKWIEISGFVIILSELGFFIIGSIAYCIRHSMYF